MALLIMMAIINPPILLSGTWLPASYLQENLGNVIQVNPIYQALAALSEIAVSGARLVDIFLELGVVSTYIVVLGAITVYLYEKRVTA